MIKQSLLNCFLLRPVWSNPITEQIRRRLVKQGGRVKLLLGEVTLISLLAIIILNEALGRYSGGDFFDFIERNSPTDWIEIVFIIFIYFSYIGGLIILVCWPLAIGSMLNGALMRLPLYDFKVIEGVEQTIVESIKPVLKRYSLGHILSNIVVLYIVFAVWAYSDIYKYNIEWALPYIACSHLWAFGYFTSILYLHSCTGTMGQKPTGAIFSWKHFARVLGSVWEYPIIRVVLIVIPGAIFVGILEGLGVRSSNRDALVYLSGWIIVIYECYFQFHLLKRSWKSWEFFQRRFRQIIDDSKEPAGS